MHRTKYTLYRLALPLVALVMGGVGTYLVMSFGPETIRAQGSTTNFGIDKDLFYDYGNWSKSANLKSTDRLAQTLYILARARDYDGSDGTTDSVNPQSFTDINGDGLIDILHHWYTTTNSSSGPDRYFGAILLNRGDLNFELVYKCVWDALKESGKAWYGDCAATQ